MCPCKDQANPISSSGDVNLQPRVPIWLAEGTALMLSNCSFNHKRHDFRHTHLLDHLCHSNSLVYNETNSKVIVAFITVVH